MYVPMLFVQLQAPQMMCFFPHFSLLAEQTKELEETCAIETELTFPGEMAAGSNDSHITPNDSNRASHFHPLSQVTSDAGNVNTYGDEIIKLTEQEEEVEAELKDSIAECRQTAGQSELSCLSDGESSLSSPHPLDSIEPSNLDNEHTNENWALEEDGETFKSGIEEKDENMGLMDIKGN